MKSLSPDGGKGKEMDSCRHFFSVINKEKVAKNWQNCGPFADRKEKRT
jgi:hypothetical protein